MLLVLWPVRSVFSFHGCTLFFQCLEMNVTGLFSFNPQVMQKIQDKRNNGLTKIYAITIETLQNLLFFL